MTLLADGTVTSQVINALSNNGFWVFLGICVLASSAQSIATRVMKHRERIAMIESGMHPEAGSTVPFQDADSA